MKNSMEEYYAGFVGGCAQSIACPNCWGVQEWESNYEKKELAVNNGPKAFIQNFVDKHLRKVFK